MRIPLTTAVALLVLLALASVLLTRQWRGQETVGVAGSGGTDPGATDAAVERNQRPRADALPPGTVALRALPPKVDADRLADAPTTWLRVRDHATGLPVFGASVRRLPSAASIAFTDAQGLAAVPLREPEPLAVVMDGYLLRLVPSRPGTTEAEPQAVQLVRDAWSWRRRFHFVGADGSVVAEAFVQFRSEAGNVATKSPVPIGDAVAVGAWSEHAVLAGHPASDDLAVQPGTWSEDRAHRLAEGNEVRFVAAGLYAIAASTLDGLVGTGTLRIDEEPTRPAAAVTVTITLQPGAFLDGAVVDAHSGAPLEAATVTLQGGDPMGLQVTTGANGSFILGPLAPGHRYLELRHNGHDPTTFGPVQVPGETLRVAMREQPR